MSAVMGTALSIGLGIAFAAFAVRVAHSELFGSHSCCIRLPRARWGRARNRR